MLTKNTEETRRYSIPTAKDPPSSSSYVSYSEDMSPSVDAETGRKMTIDNFNYDENESWHEYFHVLKIVSTS